MHDPSAYGDISDIIKKEFTLKKPFSQNAEMWKQKILSAECSVSMHFRHGDFAYNPGRKLIPNFPILPLDYYTTCIDILKQQCETPPAVFVFSNNMPWVKENLRLDVPTEFVEGCETDDQEFILMSLCKHNIVAGSNFSRRAAWLNPNPDKKIFAPGKSTAEGVKQFLSSLTPEKKDSILKSKEWIWIPYDFYNQPEITQRPIFSLLLVVNNDAATLSATLDNLLNQDYSYYEVVIIDNASTDGSDKIYRQVVEDKKNVTFKRLETKVSNSAAWNEAFKAAQGKYVSFLKVGDRFLSNSLSTLYCINEYQLVDIIHMFDYLEENANGKVDFCGKKFFVCRDQRFTQAKNNVIMSRNGLDAARLLLNKEINSFLGTKLFYRDFLTENKIKFDETLDDETAEISFQKEAFLKSKYLMYLENAFYVAPPLLKYRQPLRYQTHVTGKGWKDGWKIENLISDDINQKRDIQAIKIDFPNRKVYYSVYYDDKEGWSEEVTAPETAGTTGQSKPIMGIRILLDEKDAKETDILYRVHTFDGEWTDWAKNGEVIYSHGVKLNAIQIKLANKFNKNSA